MPNFSHDLNQITVSFTNRVDDILMDLHPDASFDKADGTKITYVRYFQEAYRLQIQDRGQPMLLHRAKPREQRARRQEGHKEEETQDVHLVPELCYLTGMSDEMKADFRVMKDIAVHTRITPGVREKRMLDFMEVLEGVDKKLD